MRNVGSFKPSSSVLSISAYQWGVVLAVAGTALFSSKTILIKLAYSWQVSPLELLSLRMVFALPFYLVIAACVAKTTQLPVQAQLVLAAAAVGSLGYYLASYLDLQGIALISAQLERLLVFTYPCFVVLLAWAFKQQRPSAKQWTSLAFTYSGALLLFGLDFRVGGEHIALGAALVLASALAYAAYVVLSQSLIGKLGSLWFTCIAMGAAALCSIAHQQFAAGLAPLTRFPVEVYYYALAIAVFATVLPSFMLAAALKRMNSGQVAILGGAGPVVTALLAVLVLKEHFGWVHGLSTLLVIAGALLVAKDK